MIVEDNMEFDNPIEDLNDYLKRISDIRKNIKSDEGEEPDLQKFFFRGQANRDWDVVPGIFRQNYLSSEAQMLNSAFLRNPSEFKLLDTDFEKLAKLQHYGLPTRLLDVTNNPLVALYFACQSNMEHNEKTGEQVETDGIVFFQRAYGKGYNDFEISVVSSLANTDIDGETTLSKTLDSLKDRGIYTSKSAEECRKNNYKSLIDIIQGNYFVISNLNNERLIRQSGAFLLVGKYNITINQNDVGESIIQPAIGSVKNEFQKEAFIIPADNKLKILEELDFYNINEGSLFPELEHQMTYVKNTQTSMTSPTIGAFSKVEFTVEKEEKIPPLEKEISEEDMRKIVDKVIKENVNAKAADEYKTAITDNLAVDWYRKDSVLSKMKMALTDVFSLDNFDRETAKKNATMVVSKLAEAIKVLTENIE